LLITIIGLTREPEKILSDMGADSYVGFCNKIVAENSPFGRIINKFGEQNLIEVLRFRENLGKTISRQVSKHKQSRPFNSKLHYTLSLRSVFQVMRGEKASGACPPIGGSGNRKQA